MFLARLSKHSTGMRTHEPRTEYILIDMFAAVAGSLSTTARLSPRH
jgi:hypothetical protein